MSEELRERLDAKLSMRKGTMLLPAVLALYGVFFAARHTSDDLAWEVSSTVRPQALVLEPPQINIAPRHP